MYKIICFFAGAFLLSGGVSLQADDQWKLVWSDEFNGKNLDYSKWGVEVNAFGGGNQEMQLYTDRPENLRIELSLIHI